MPSRAAASTASLPQAGAGSPGAMGVALGGMLALASAMGVGRFVYTPILPAMAEALALTKSQAGLIASANFVGYLAGALLLAQPHLPGGRRLWFLAALAVSAACMAAMAPADAMANAMGAFMALRFAGGIASAFALILGSAVVLDRLGAMGRPGLAAIHFAGVGLGIAASAVVVDGTQAAGGDWRALWLASAALAALAACACPLLIPAEASLVPPRPAAAPSAASAAAPALPQRAARALASLNLCHGLFGFGYVITATFLVAAVRAAPGARVLEPAVWVLVGLAAMPSTWLWSRIGSRRGALVAYGLACLLEAVGVAAGGVWANAAGAVLAAVLLGGTFMGITALGFAAARTLAPDQQRRSFAVMTAAFGAGQIVGPIAAGWLIDRTGSFLAPSLLGAAALVVGGVLALATAHATRPGATAPTAQAAPSSSSSP
jgi:MFS family permease